MKAKEPTVPPASNDTIRRRILALLIRETLSAREISQVIGIPEKEVHDHLTHLLHRRRGERVVAVPAECRSCGFVFSKRDRPTSPGKCPICRSEQISEPLFAVSGHDAGGL